MTTELKFWQEHISIKNAMLPRKESQETLAYNIIQEYYYVVLRL